MDFSNLIPSKPQDSSCTAWFEQIADCLLNRTHVYIGGEPHRFVEIEFYYRNKELHDDPSVHCDPLQKSCGNWYFHRFGGTYREGSFKGVDITFGEEDCFGGVLIRGIEKPNGEVVDGPSLCVDYLLAQSQTERVADLDEKVVGAKVWDNTKPIYIQKSTIDTRKLHTCGRVGLTLKYASKAAQMQKFIMSSYRYLTTPRKTKKGRVYTILGLHSQGKNVVEIKELTGSTQKGIEGYISQFDLGKQEKDFSSYIGQKLSTAKTAQLYGTWFEHYSSEVR